MACYYHPQSADLRASEVNYIETNFCYGSQDKGFVVALNPCTGVTIANNGVNDLRVSAARIGILLVGQANTACQEMSNMYVYNSQIGIVANPPTTNLLRLKNFFLIDNQLGLSVRQGFGSKNSANITTILDGGKIELRARPGCDYCYGSTLVNCTGSRGIRYGSSTFNGNTITNGTNSNPDSIDSPSAYDSKLLIIGVEMLNFKTAAGTGNLLTCSNSKVF